MMVENQGQFVSRRGSQAAPNVGLGHSPAKKRWAANGGLAKEKQRYSFEAAKGFAASKQFP